MGYALIVKYLVIVFAISMTAYLGATKLMAMGYEDAKSYYEPIIRKHEDNQIAKIASVEGLVKGLVANTDAYNASLINDIDSIRSGLKGKTIVVYKDGKCTLSKEFLDSRAAAINRANQR